MKQRIFAKFLHLSCLSHLFFFSKNIENRRFFEKLLIHWIIQFDNFFLFKLCNNLTCNTWLYIFVTFTFMIVIILSLSCFYIACISFVSIFSVVSFFFFVLRSFITLIIVDFFSLILWFYWLIDLFKRRCDIKYVDLMRICLLFLYIQKNPSKNKNLFFHFFIDCTSKLFRCSFDALNLMFYFLCCSFVLYFYSFSSCWFDENVHESM